MILIVFIGRYSATEEDWYDNRGFIGQTHELAIRVAQTLQL
jgi:hypothetical protein